MSPTHKEPEARERENLDYLSPTLLEQTQEDLFESRRELLRWKVMAAEYKQQIADMESSASWRYSAPIRAIPILRRRWKELALLGLIGLITLPVWPIFALAALSSYGRQLLWSGASRFAPTENILKDILNRLRPATSSSATHGDPGIATPLIYHRPVNTEPNSQGLNDSQRLHNLLKQLCPQRRHLINKLGWKNENSVKADELQELLSLSRSEDKLLRLCLEAAATNNTSARPDQ